MNHHPLRAIDALQALDADRHLLAEVERVLADATLSPASRARLELIAAALAGPRREAP